jgi:hypothetical protein
MLSLMYVRLSVKNPLFYFDCNETWLSNFMKIRRVGVELFEADVQTDMTRLIVASCNFANAPKMH